LEQEKLSVFFMKPSQRPIPSDRTMALLDDVVEIFDLTNHDRNILAGIDLSARRSLLPFMKQRPSLGYLQDFIDKVVAVIEQKKLSPKPIADPVAFLFGCLKKMEINPPPGWKSRAVRMLEEEERRLKAEAEELRAAGSRVEQQRCELYFLRLSPEQQAEITRETDAVGEGDIPMIQEAKRAQRYLELIRALMRQETTTSSR
jgi:hypothetical protein